VKQIDVKRVVGEVAAKHGVLVEENGPLMVALTANGVVLDTRGVGAGTSDGI